MQGTQRGRVGAGQGMHTHCGPNPQSISNTHPNDTVPPEAKSVRHLQNNGESSAEAVDRICTHRCAHYPSLIMSPDSCARRIKKIRANPIVTGPMIAWECANCTGPVPKDGNAVKPDLPKLMEHDTRYLRPRSYKCCKCGTDDITKFDKGHSRKCRDCVKVYEAEKSKAKAIRDKEDRAASRLVCCRCGRNINMGDRGNRERAELRLCGACFRTLKSRRR